MLVSFVKLIAKPANCWYMNTFFCKFIDNFKPIQRGHTTIKRVVNWKPLKPNRFSQRKSEIFWKSIFLMLSELKDIEPFNLIQSAIEEGFINLIVSQQLQPRQLPLNFHLPNKRIDSMRKFLLAQYRWSIDYQRVQIKTSVAPGIII